MTTNSLTTTFTIADVRKVIENFAADFSMITRYTGIHSRDYVAQMVADLRIFADSRYLAEVTLMLKDKYGNKLNAAVYKVSESAAGWVSERPGNNNWPKTPDGSLSVALNMTSIWNVKTEAEKSAFYRANGFNLAWGPVTQDFSLIGLSSSSGQKYSSNGYGWERTNYTKP